MKFYYVFLIVFGGLNIIEKVESATFPRDFIFGFATASYQIEGGWNEDGKGENVWDRFVHTQGEKIEDGSTGDVACDSYHKYKEDVQMLKNLGAKVYRFSLSWSRILPTGGLSQINRPGITYYRNLIEELVLNEIEPMITLFHWDLPQALQDLGGWANPIMIDYFQDYAKLAFDEYGNKVKWWITFNEPFETCKGAYGSNEGAPAVNKSGVGDYLCAHTILKSHARVYHMYNDSYKSKQKGKLGISLNGGWNKPMSDSVEDIKAAETALEFQLGWFLHPLLGSGSDYPKIMRMKIDEKSRNQNLPRSRLPRFSNTWKTYIQGTLDFLGINHYSTWLATPSNDILPVPSFEDDMGVSLSQNKSWPPSTATWLKVEPTGFRMKLKWLKDYTNNFPIFVTENGYCDSGELDDYKRINYYKLYLNALLKAIDKDKCNVIGYIAWSLMDNFEWLQGYKYKFGIYKVDFSDPDRSRTAKASVQFFKNLIKMKDSNMEMDQFLKVRPEIN